MAKLVTQRFWSRCIFYFTDIFNTFSLKRFFNRFDTNNNLVYNCGLKEIIKWLPVHLVELRFIHVGISPKMNDKSPTNDLTPSSPCRVFQNFQQSRVFIWETSHTTTSSTDSPGCPTQGWGWSTCCSYTTRASELRLVTVWTLPTSRKIRYVSCRARRFWSSVSPSNCLTTPSGIFQPAIRTWCRHFLIIGTRRNLHETTSESVLGWASEWAQSGKVFLPWSISL